MKSSLALVLVGIAVVIGTVLMCTFVFSRRVALLNPSNGNGPIDQGDGGNQLPDDDRGADTASASGNIIVTSPVPKEIIGVPLVIKGSARVFESTFNYRLLDADGTVLTEGNVMANAPDIGEFGNFTITASYSAPSGKIGSLEVFDYSAKDGSVIDLVAFPVAFPSGELMTIKTFWTTAATEDACSAVVPSERRVAKSVATAYAALTELLAGPNTPESMSNMTTSIPKFVSIKNLTINDGVAKVEFSASLETGGSCRVTSIRAQIESTLKQFPTVTSVIISTEGNTPSESLQP